MMYMSLQHVFLLALFLSLPFVPILIVFTYLDSSFAACQTPRLGSSLDFFLMSPAGQHLAGITRQRISHLGVGVHAHLGRVSRHVLTHRRHRGHGGPDRRLRDVR